MFVLALSITVMLTLMSGAAATWLAMSKRGDLLVRLRVADRLALAAVLGALAVYTLLSID